MKIREIRINQSGKIGKVVANGVTTELHELSTALYLAQFGFDVEFIRPVNTKKTHNPDVLIFGTIWEIKRPKGSNQNTIKNRFHKASKQADKVIFDLRDVKDVDQTEEFIMQLFKESGRVRRIMIIKNGGGKGERILDIIK